MGAVWMRARAELRSRWRAWAAIAILVGLFGGAVATAAAGARRTDSAYPRFLERARSFDVFIGDFSVFAPIFWSVDFDALKRLPYVERTAEVRHFFATEDAELLVPVDDTYGRELNRAKVLRGRLPTAVDEVSVPFAWDPPTPVEVGDTIPVRFDEPEPMTITMRVVGVHAMPGDFPPQDILGRDFIAAPAFFERYGEQLPSIPASFLRFERGAADVPRFDEDLRRLSGGKVVSALRNHEQAANVQRSFHLQAIALWILAGALGIGAALVLGQTIARQTVMESDEDRTLRALGMSRAQLLLTGLVRVGVVALVGAVIAVVLAWLASPLFPRGLARVAEPHPGLSFDATVAGLSALGIAVVAVLGAIVPLMRRATRATAAAATVPGQTRPSMIASALARAGFRPPAVAGVRFALEPGRGRSGVPVRSTIAAVSIGITALTAAFTFGSNLDHLLATPRLYGLGWDHGYGFSTDDSAVPESARRLAATDPSVDAAVEGAIGLPLEVAVNGERLPVHGMAMNPIVGSVVPDPIRGRFPGPGEVLLGPRVLERIGARVGDRIEVGVQGARSTRLVVSGVGVLPPVLETSQFGDGVLVRYDTVNVMAPEGEQVPPPDQLFVRFREGIDRAAAIEAFRGKLEHVDQDYGLPRPADLVNFGRVQNLPVVLAGLLAALAGGALAHVLLTAVRRRRRDLAILKTLGFRRAQTRATVAWHASATTALALVLGVPLGIASGRWLWATFAEQTGVVVELAIPWTPLLITIPAALALANVVAAFPARAAARTQPAVVLKSE